MVGQHYFNSKLANFLLHAEIKTVTSHSNGRSTSKCSQEPTPLHRIAEEIRKRCIDTGAQSSNSRLTRLAMFGSQHAWPVLTCVDLSWLVFTCLPFVVCYAESSLLRKGPSGSELQCTHSTGLSSVFEYPSQLLISWFLLVILLHFSRLKPTIPCPLMRCGGALQWCLWNLESAY